VNNAHDVFLVFLYKKVRDVVCWRAFLFHETLLLHQPRPVSSSRSTRTPIHPFIHSSILWFAASWAANSVAALPRWELCVSAVKYDLLLWLRIGCAGVPCYCPKTD
jgi:hypothetical protein